MKKLIIIVLAFFLVISCYDMTPIAASTNQTSTFKVNVIWPWDTETTYKIGDMVTTPPFITGGAIYRSIVDTNQGNNPLETLGWWTLTNLKQNYPAQ